MWEAIKPRERRFAGNRGVLTVNQEVYKIPCAVSFGALRAKSMIAADVGCPELPPAEPQGLQAIQ